MSRRVLIPGWPGSFERGILLAAGTCEPGLGRGGCRGTATHQLAVHRGAGGERLLFWKIGLDRDGRQAATDQRAADSPSAAPVPCGSASAAFADDRLIRRRNR